MRPSRKQVAYHEAAHAVAHFRCFDPDVGIVKLQHESFEFVTIEPESGENYGKVQISATFSKDVEAENTKTTFNAICICMLAGPVADEIFNSQIPSDVEWEGRHREGDDKQIKKFLADYFEPDRSQIWPELRRQRERTRALLEIDWLPQIELLASQLLKRSTLSYAEVKAILEPKER